MKLRVSIDKPGEELISYQKEIEYSPDLTMVRIAIGDIGSDASVTVPLFLLDYCFKKLKV